MILFLFSNQSSMNYLSKHIYIAYLEFTANRAATVKYKNLQRGFLVMLDENYKQWSSTYVWERVTAPTMLSSSGVTLCMLLLIKLFSLLPNHWVTIYRKSNHVLCFLKNLHSKGILAYTLTSTYHNVIYILHCVTICRVLTTR